MQSQLSKLFLSTIEGYYPVDVDELIYCAASRSYTYFYITGGKQYLTPKLLKEYEDLLTPHHFFRIHKSFLVNIRHIEKIIKADGLSVVMSNRTELPVSFRKKNEFIHTIRNFNAR